MMKKKNEEEEEEREERNENKNSDTNQQRCHIGGLLTVGCSRYLLLFISDLFHCLPVCLCVSLSLSISLSSLLLCFHLTFSVPSPPIIIHNLFTIGK